MRQRQKRERGEKKERGEDGEKGSYFRPGEQQKHQTNEQTRLHVARFHTLHTYYIYSQIHQLHAAK